VELSPAYDVLSTVPYGDRKMALSLDGRDDNLKRASLLRFGERFGVREAAITLLLDDLCARTAQGVAELPEIGFDARKTRHLGTVMRQRIGDLAAP